MDFIKRFNFHYKSKDRNKKNASLRCKKGKRSIFNYHNNERLRSSTPSDVKYRDDDDDQEIDHDEDDYNSNRMIFHQRPLHPITALNNNPGFTETNNTNQPNVHHCHENPDLNAQKQLPSLLPMHSKDFQQQKDSSIAFKQESKIKKDTNHLSAERKHIKSESFNYSAMYVPFIERPGIVETDYIPLPTVTRKYIDPPSDALLDSIPSFRIQKQNHVSGITTSSVEIAANSSQKSNNKLVVDTKILGDSSLVEQSAPKFTHL
ncbi:hypothetical protein BD408DRAFT_415665 [Parasitella parasitica]|nr:hypothetical protein BD408DRAFT_415665 [Parasitella parasitica]